MAHQKVSPERKHEMRLLYAGGLSLREIGERFGVADRTVRNCLTLGAVEANRKALRCLRCDRVRQNKARMLCHECARAAMVHDEIPAGPAVIVRSDWQTLPDGTRMRTVMGA